MPFRQAQTAKGSAVSHKLKWTASYLPDRYPQATTAITTFIALEIWIDSVYDTEECSATFQALKWCVFIPTGCYLVFIGFQTASTVSFSKFMRSFHGNLVVLPLMLCAMVSLPPLPCYLGSSDTVTLIGVTAIFVVGVMCYLSDWWQQRGQRDEDNLGDVVSADESNGDGQGAKVERDMVSIDGIGIQCKDFGTGLGWGHPMGSLKYAIECFVDGPPRREVPFFLVCDLHRGPSQIS